MLPIAQVKEYLLKKKRLIITLGRVGESQNTLREHIKINSYLQCLFPTLAKLTIVLDMKVFLSDHIDSTIDKAHI